MLQGQRDLCWGEVLSVPRLVMGACPSQKGCIQASVTLGAGFVRLDAVCHPGRHSPAHPMLSLCTSMSPAPFCACPLRGPSRGGSLGWAAARP